MFSLIPALALTSHCAAQCAGSLERPAPVQAGQEVRTEGGDLFMEEVVPNKPKPAKSTAPIKVDVSNLGVPVDQNGRIVPIKDLSTGPVRQNFSTIQQTYESPYNFLPAPMFNGAGRPVNIYGQPVNAFGQAVNQFGMPINPNQIGRTPAYFGQATPYLNGQPLYGYGGLGGFGYGYPGYGYPGYGYPTYGYRGYGYPGVYPQLGYSGVPSFFYPNAAYPGVIPSAIGQSWYPGYPGFSGYPGYPLFGSSLRPSFGLNLFLPSTTQFQSTSLFKPFFGNLSPPPDTPSSSNFSNSSNNSSGSPSANSDSQSNDASTN